MHIAHITDTHIVAEGTLLNGRTDVAARLQLAVHVINALEPSIDAVIVSGDLVNDGDEEAYRYLLTLLESLEAPFYLVPGNHDSRSEMQRLFGGTSFFPVTSGFGHYTVDTADLRLIALDSSIEGQEKPAFCAERAAWLSQTLAEDTATPTLLFIHHPPIRTGIGFYDLIADPDWADKLQRLIKASHNVKLVACGHVHTHVNGMIGQARIVAAPGPAFQLQSEIGNDAPPRLIDQPGDILVHAWTGVDVITVPVPVTNADPGPDITELAGLSWEELKTLWQSKGD